MYVNHLIRRDLWYHKLEIHGSQNSAKLCLLYKIENCGYLKNWESGCAKVNLISFNSLKFNNQKCDTN